MKKIFFALAIATAAISLTGCGETWDDNPRLDGHEGVAYADFLNPPVMQNTQVMITSENNTGSLHLTCSQPYYGYAAAATYHVQVSLTKEFTEYKELTQDFYDCSQINPVLSDIASAIETLSGVKTEADLPLPYRPLYVRLRSWISQSPDNTEYLSNVVAFNAVACDYLAIWVAGQPANLYLRGGMNEWGASEEYQFYTADEEYSWATNIVTIPNGTEFKVADSSWAPINLGWGTNGAGDDTGDITPDEIYHLTWSENPGNLTMKGDFTGQAVLRLEKGNYTLVLDSTKGAPAE